MLVKAEEREPLANLLYFLELGERLAQQCATAQAAMAPTPKMRRFLAGQAQQEAFHAKVFHGARLWMAPWQTRTTSSLEPFEEYAALLRATFDRHDFLESILAEQVILESLGEAILYKLEEGLQKQGAPFRRLRSILLHQEAAHHGFGERVLEQAIVTGALTREELQERAVPYLELSSTMVLGLQTLFEEIDEDPDEYLTLQRQYLPEWLVEVKAKV